MYKIIIFTALLLMSYNLFSDDNLYDYCHWNINDTIKVIDKTKNYRLRLYFFVELSSCSVCTEWAKYFASKYKEKNVEIVIFLNNTTQQDANNKKNELGWEAVVVGDEYGIYNTYYKIKLPSTILILNNQGIILDLGKLGSERISENHIEDLLEISKNNIHIKEKNNYLKEIKRVPVIKDSFGLVSGFFREVLFDESHNKFIIRNNRQCRIDIADSNGKIIKSLTNSEFYHCELGVCTISWAFQDSIVAIPSGIIIDGKFELEMAYLNILNDSFYKSIIYRFPIENNNNFSLDLNPQFNTDNNEFICNIKFLNNKNTYLNDNDKLFYVYNFDGNFIKSFGLPDDIYKKYKLSTFTIHSVTFNNIGEPISIQGHSKKIQFFDKNKNLIKIKELNLLDDFRVLDFSIPDSNYSSKYPKIRNNMSQFPELFCDKTNNNIMLCWLNQTYPDGISDFFSNEVENKVFLCLLDKDGNRLIDKNILMPPTFSPFNFKNNLIYGTELNKNKLEIVVYSVIKTPRE